MNWLRNAISLQLRRITLWMSASRGRAGKSRRDTKLLQRIAIYNSLFYCVVFYASAQMYWKNSFGTMQTVDRVLFIASCSGIVAGVTSLILATTSSALYRRFRKVIVLWIVSVLSLFVGIILEMFGGRVVGIVIGMAFGGIMIAALWETDIAFLGNGENRNGNEE